jgi:glucose-1-phosphate adenylyltransferase
VPAPRRIACVRRPAGSIEALTRIKTLTVILAGGAGGRLELLTRRRAKPAVQYGGTHKLIDFPLSNCANSGIEDVWVVQQFNPISLSDHLANGRPWDLDRTTGGLLVLQPRLGHDEREGFQQGTADSLWRNAPLIRQFAPDALVVVSADAVYRLDYARVVEDHMASEAAVTMVTYEVGRENAARYGVVEVEDGRITGYEYKPDEPKTGLIANEVFVFDPDTVLDLLDELAEEAGDDGLRDLGHGLLPQLVDAGRAREWRMAGYWRDVGTVDAYWSSHMDLLDDEPPLELDDPSWPILTKAPVKRSSARVRAEARVADALLAPTTYVAGTVERSVIGRGSIVEAGAVVRDSVLLEGIVVRSGATVTRAVIDSDVEIGADATVGEDGGELALIGEDVDAGARVPAGGRHPDEDD